MTSHNKGKEKKINWGLVKIQQAIIQLQANNLIGRGRITEGVYKSLFEIPDEIKHLLDDEKINESKQ